MDESAAVKNPQCSAPDCSSLAEYAVFLYDVYMHLNVEVFHEPHSTCPYLCQAHLNENERAAGAIRRYKGQIDYPHTHSMGTGFVIYRALRDVQGVQTA